MKRILPLLLIAFASAAYAGGDVLREDTATQIALGPFLDGTDGVTAETALTVTEFDCDLVKHADSGMTNTALTITASAGSNDAAHIQSGMYSLELTATDTNTAGRLTIICDHATPATFVPVRQTYMVMPTQEYDSLYGTDTLQVHVNEYTAGVIDATAIATDAIAAAAIATDAIGAAEIAADAVGAAEAGFLTDSTGFQGADIAAILTDTGTTIPATITTIDNELAVVDGVVDNILVDTAEIGVAGAGLTEAGGTGDHLTAVPWNASWDAEVESEVDDSIGGGTGTALSAIPWNASWDAEVQSEANDALVALDLDDLAKSQFTTTIATLSTQTSFTLTAGSTDADAYNGWEIIVIDASTATQVAVGIVQDYAVTTRTVTLMVDPGVFTMAVGDTVILRPANANVRQMNGYEVSGDGTTGTEWSGTGDGGL